jgi:hypothetical protein
LPGLTDGQNSFQQRSRVGEPSVHLQICPGPVQQSRGIRHRYLHGTASVGH